MTRRRAARWPMVLIAAVLLGGATLAFMTRDGREGTGPDGSSDVPAEEVDGPPAGLSRPIAAYRLTYRVEGFAADGSVLVDTERRWVRLPFQSRVEVTAGDGPDGEVTFLQVADFGVLQTGRPGEAETVALTVEPGLAPGDARVSAVNTDLLEWRHRRRTVAGRTCDVHRASGPVDIDRLAAPDTGSGSFADLCVDAAGIVLHEEWYVDGRLFRRRIATAVDERDFEPRRLFTATGTPVDVRSGGGGLAELEPGSRPESVPFFELAGGLPGFERRGRYAYTPPRSRDRSAVVEIPTVAAVLDVYVSGPDVVVVENGGTLDNSDPFEPPGAGAGVDSGVAGTGEVVAGIRTAEVRVLLERGRYVRVRGTLDAGVLVEITRSLVLASGEAPGLTPLAPPPSTTVPPREPGAAPAVECSRDDEGRLVCRQSA